MTTKQRKGIKSTVTYLEIALLAVVLAFNYKLFIVENGFAPAGINGVATMVQYKTGFSIGYMSLLINVPLCIAAYFLVHKTFARRSFCFSVVYSVVYLFLQRLDLSAIQYNAQGHDLVFPGVLSGIISGFVYGCCFRLSASTGGTDIVSKYISKRKPSLNFFWVTFVINAVVAAISFFVYARRGEDGRLIFDYTPVCLCVLYCFFTSFMGNFILQGTKSASKFTIITSHAEEISAEIHRKLHHSSTQIAGMGTYSGMPCQVLICVVNRNQLVAFQSILKKYDDTFAFSETVNETYGNFLHVKS